MLKPGEASEALKRFGRQDLLLRLGGVALVIPEAARIAGHLYAGTDIFAQGAAYERLQECRAPVGAWRLDLLPLPMRSLVLRGLFPRSAPLVAQAWEAGRGLPYQHGIARKGFRAPGVPVASAGARWSRFEAWVEAFSARDRGVEWLAEWAGTWVRIPAWTRWACSWRRRLTEAVRLATLSLRP